MSVKASSCLLSHSQLFFVLNNSLSGLEISPIRGENFPSWFTTPMNLHNLVILVGASIFLIALVVFSGLGDIPFLLMICPKNSSLSHQNLHSM